MYLQHFTIILWSFLRFILESLCLAICLYFRKQGKAPNIWIWATHWFIICPLGLVFNVSSLRCLLARQQRIDSEAKGCFPREFRSFERKNELGRWQNTLHSNLQVRLFVFASAVKTGHRLDLAGMTARTVRERITVSRFSRRKTLK